jgi:hypothetical protein
MFANVSPTQESLQETLCSLRFASQVIDIVSSNMANRLQ